MIVVAIMYKDKYMAAGKSNCFDNHLVTTITGYIDDAFPGYAWKNRSTCSRSRYNISL